MNRRGYEMTGRPSVPEWREMLASLKDGRKGQLGLLFHRGEVQYCLCMHFIVPLLKLAHVAIARSTYFLSNQELQPYCVSTTSSAHLIAKVAKMLIQMLATIQHVSYSVQVYCVLVPLQMMLDEGLYYIPTCLMVSFSFSIMDYKSLTYVWGSRPMTVF